MEHCRLACAHMVSRRAVLTDDVSDEVAAQGSWSTAPAPAIANQIGHEQLEMKKSGAGSWSALLVARVQARSSPPPHTCVLCQREFKSQHAGAACFRSLFSFLFFATRRCRLLASPFCPRCSSSLLNVLFVNVFNDTLESLITRLQLLPLMAIPSHSCPVDIHLSRNRKCRRQRAAALGQATHEPKCLLPGFPYLSHTHPGHGSHASVRAMSIVYVCLSSTCVSEPYFENRS